MSAEQAERCQLCGSPVEVVSSDDGTSYYRPSEQGDIEIIREALAYLCDCGTETYRTADAPLAALARVAAVLENRKHTHSNLNVCIEQREELRADLERVEREREGLRVDADTSQLAAKWHAEQHGEAVARAEKAEKDRDHFAGKLRSL